VPVLQASQHGVTAAGVEPVVAHPGVPDVDLEVVAVADERLGLVAVLLTLGDDEELPHPLPPHPFQQPDDQPLTAEAHRRLAAEVPPGLHRDRPGTLTPAADQHDPHNVHMPSYHLRAMIPQRMDEMSR